MASLLEFRKQYPQYGDLSDQALADALYRKFYSDMPRAVFDQKMGLVTELPPSMSLGERASDVAKSAGVGLGEGAIGIAGIPGDVQSLIQSGIESVAGPAISPQMKRDAIASGTVAETAPTPVPRLPTSADIKSMVEQWTGPFHEPKTVEGHFARTIGQHMPAAAIPLGTAGLPTRLLTQGVLPGAVSETAGQATKGTNLEPWARAGGSIAGGAVPSMVTRATSPFPLSTQRQRAVASLGTEGIEVSAGQASGRKSLRDAESALGDASFSGGRASAQAKRTAEQFTSAVLRRVGETATRATPAVIDRAFTRIGKQLDDLAARNHVVLDRMLDNKLRQIETDYRMMVGPSQQAPIVTDVLGDIIDAAASNGSRLSGEAYQAMRSRLDRAARSSRNDPELSDALFGIRNALDDAMGRSIQMRAMATGQVPTDWQAWQEARRQYRNLLVVERAAVGSGEDTAAGLLSPRQMLTALRNQNMREYARGRGDFSELVHAADEVLTPLPVSGTAQRAHGMSIPLAILGGVGGGALGGGMEAGIGASIGAIAGPGLMGRVLMSPVAQAYLRNQITAPAGARLDPLANMGLQALLNTRRPFMFDQQATQKR